MTFREIRDHKFKILFNYYFLQENVEKVILDYFENYPYEEDDDKNEYISGIGNAHINVNKVVIKEENRKVENESDKAVEIKLGDEENIRDIKQKVRDIVSKTNDIDTMIKENLKDWDMTRVGKAELTIIRLALYEMYYDTSIDLEVAINEAVEHRGK